MDKSKYLFKSDRLGFRKWTMEDFDEFYALNSDEEVMKHFPNTLSKKEVKMFINQLMNHFDKYGYTYYATEILESNEFIGMIGIAYQNYHTEFTPSIDIGWRLKRSCWGKGYATEGAQRCLDYAFNKLGIIEIISVCTENNTKSENVMKKIGMRKVGEFRHPEMSSHPEYEKHLCYAMAKQNN